MQITCTTPGFTGLKDGLISSTGLHTKTEVVYSKRFQHPSYTLSLRPFSIPQDMPAIYKWAWKLSRAANTVAASYLYAGSSDFARSFMVLLNNRLALCQVDICTAEKDELYDTFPTSSGDYIIRLLMNANRKTIRPLHLKALQTCMEYFFLFPEIKQIIAEPEADNKLYNEILSRAGFQQEEQVFSQYSICNLLVCTRKSFIPE
ncbi:MULTISPECIES: GNAT family N-acetyltransferase [Niastella]|uniref:GNAT family N-acetyltransferase n=1 Tax=Niastella soli TaxID=2821487 RepID=A0ABS3YLN9_9BACT|nr:GNAT family N-acetyltransferase [Niastella soli]MBO9198811.1 GNAT family N-acetyltransferase [Niastella soli]